MTPGPNLIKYTVTIDKDMVIVTPEPTAVDSVEDECWEMFYPASTSPDKHEKSTMFKLEPYVHSRLTFRGGKPIDSVRDAVALNLKDVDNATRLLRRWATTPRPMTVKRRKKTIAGPKLRAPACRAPCPSPEESEWEDILEVPSSPAIKLKGPRQYVFRK